MFDAQAYLREYYGDIGAENLALLRFLVNGLRSVSPDSLMLDFGSGPTIYSLITASVRVKEIHVCDYVESNLDEVRKWLRRDPTAFNWREFIETTLELEGKDNSPRSVFLREQETRNRVTRLVRGDASLPSPLGKMTSQYDLLVSNFCAESATSDWSQWRVFIHNITSLLKPGGTFMLAALKGADSYSVGDTNFPAVRIMEQDLLQALVEEGFVRKSIAIESVPADRPSRHYEGLMLARATKSP